jgi:Cu-Zn family superoxide dismutase
VVFLACLIASPGAQSDAIRARAVLRDVNGNEVGTVLFTQAPIDHNFPTPSVDVVARVEGLTAGLHGMQIHENGNCDPGLPGGARFIAAGGHFDPGPNGNSQSDGNHPFHLGDLPNVDVNEAGVGHLRAVTSRITLSPGPLSVFDADNPNTLSIDPGSAVVVHQNPDQGITGAPGSGVSGGPRIACGLIEVD